MAGGQADEASEEEGSQTAGWQGTVWCASCKAGRDGNGNEACVAEGRRVREQRAAGVCWQRDGLTRR
ncbi:hypothetical protein MVI01_00180 [Myxococcus virescens]|uniref:Uncharacterized protein n=1 Tax=Myxococcus virescens TaxID=83456 RepID=A0A511H4C7_9BACT|nr:hypothetical protein MVI01_00180 [Myxococcus virescens]